MRLWTRIETMMPSDTSSIRHSANFHEKSGFAIPLLTTTTVVMPQSKNA